MYTVVSAKADQKALALMGKVRRHARVCCIDKYDYR